MNRDRLQHLADHLRQDPDKILPAETNPDSAAVEAGYFGLTSEEASALFADEASAGEVAKRIAVLLERD